MQWVGALNPPGIRPTWAEIDVAAIEANARLLAEVAAPASLCAVVKAGGYGHGAVQAARAAIAGGATMLAVALVEEGAELREAGITEPILVLSEPPAAAMREVVQRHLMPTIYSLEGVKALASAAAPACAPGPGITGPPGGVPMHVKVDTGMHRVGADPAGAVELVSEVLREGSLRLAAISTHLAVADEQENPYTKRQLDAFETVLTELRHSGVDPGTVHAANSAATLWCPRSRYDMVRCGISLYGLAPCDSVEADPIVARLRPAMSLRSRVSHVMVLDAGERISYGLRYTLPARSVVAAVPLGYADGVPRGLPATGAEVLVGGRRVPMAGTVTMDQLMVDCGPGADVSLGDEVVLIGAQGGEVIGAWDWARRMGTISYETVCGISSRVPRVYVGASP